MNFALHGDTKIYKCPEYILDNSVSLNTVGVDSMVLIFSMYAINSAKATESSTKLVSSAWAWARAAFLCSYNGQVGWYFASAAIKSPPANLPNKILSSINVAHSRTLLSTQKVIT